MVATFSGPQAIVGWVAGAALAICDGLVWAELGAAMPGAGGTYLYLREAFQYRTGKLMPFLFIWTIILTIPLIMSTGIIGLEQYLSYFFPHLSYWPMHLIGIGITAAIVFLLYRRIESIRVITTALWIVMLLAVGLTIAASYSSFHPSLAFHYPSHAFAGGFVTALGAGLLIAIYDYLGYNTAAYMGGELRNLGGIACDHAQLGPGRRGRDHRAHPDNRLRVGIRRPARRVAGAVPRGPGPALLRGVRPPSPEVRFPARVTAGDGSNHRRGQLLHADHGHQRAARGHHLDSGHRADRRADRTAPPSARLDPALQAVAVPPPSLAALAGWLYVYASATVTALIWSTVWLAAGVAAYLGWARYHHHWPFGPKQIREVFVEAQREHPDQVAAERGAQWADS